MLFRSSPTVYSVLVEMCPKHKPKPGPTRYAAAVSRAEQRAALAEADRVFTEKRAQIEREKCIYCKGWPSCHLHCVRTRKIADPETEEGKRLVEELKIKMEEERKNPQPAKLLVCSDACDEHHVYDMH